MAQYYNSQRFLCFRKKSLISAQYSNNTFLYRFKVSIPVSYVTLWFTSASCYIQILHHEPQSYTRSRDGRFTVCHHFVINIETTINKYRQKSVYVKLPHVENTPTDKCSPRRTWPQFRDSLRLFRLQSISLIFGQEGIPKSRNVPQ
jgi:hypothetical protein